MRTALRGVAARARDAALIPVIAWEPPGGDRADWDQPSGYLRQEWRNLAARRLRDALIAVWGEVPDDPLVQPHVERGPAGWVLATLADRPDDLLIVGAGRRGTLARLAFPRVGGYCLAHAGCPVLAIPPPPPARDCRVSMARTLAGLAVEVTDDGTGLHGSGHHGHGLAIMRERAEEIGGTVTVRDGSSGVTVQARLPAVTTPAQLPGVPAVPA